MQTAVAEQISVPAEWAPQKAIWTAWPADPEQWDGDLATPRREVAALVRALEPGEQGAAAGGGRRGRSLRPRRSSAERAEIVPARYGDIWLRDTGPIFAARRARPVALRFRHQWLGRQVRSSRRRHGRRRHRAARPARRCANSTSCWKAAPIEQDGEGTILTTRQTLLNANRNGWTEPQAEAALREAFGAQEDHLDRPRASSTTTPTAISTRSPASSRLAASSASLLPATDDPNAEVLEAIARALEAATDASGRKLEVVRIPSPGRVLDALGEIAPASHVNFVIANGIVVVPIYGTPSGEQAVQALQKAFPDRKVIGLPSRGVLGSGLAGGGSFHCITREEPL